MKDKEFESYWKHVIEETWIFPNEDHKRQVKDQAYSLWKNARTPLENHISQLKTEIRDLESELEDGPFFPESLSETEELIHKWKPEISTFIEKLKNAKPLLGLSNIHAIEVYDDELKDMIYFLTEITK